MELRQQPSSRVRDLDAPDVSSILARNTVGRLAFRRGEQIDVLPIHYVYQDGAIYGRTSAAVNLGAVDPEGSAVAFEVDEIQSALSWRSVLAHGTLRVVEQDAGHEQGVAASGVVRRLHQAVLQDNGQPADHTEIFRILIDDATGRACG